MSFLQHLEALRWHVVRSAAVVMSLALGFFFFKEFLFDGVLLAPKNPDFLTYRLLCQLTEKYHLGEDLCVKEAVFTLIATATSPAHIDHVRLAAGTYFIRVTSLGGESNYTLATTTDTLA